MPTDQSRKRSFLKTLFTLEKFENAGFCVLVWMENTLTTENLENDDVNHVINPNPQGFTRGFTQAFLPPVIVAFSNFSGRLV